MRQLSLPSFAMGKVPDDTAWRRVKPFPKVSAPRIRYSRRPRFIA